jgi:hypothetical protein
VIPAPSMQSSVRAHLEERRHLGFTLSISGSQLMAFARFADQASHCGPLTSLSGLPSRSSRRQTAPAVTRTFDFAAHDSPHYGNALVAIGGGHQRDCAMARARKPSTTHMYIEADLSMKERALQRLTPSAPNKARYRPPNSFFRFLQSL